MNEVHTDMARDVVRPHPGDAAGDAASDAAIIADCAGVCFPGPGGQTADFLDALARAGLRRPALDLLATLAVTTPQWIGDYAQTLRQAIDALSEHEFIAAFRPAVAFHALSDETVAATPAQTGLGLVRFLVGGANATPVTCVIPEPAFGPGGLYFPHLNAIVFCCDGPVAVRADGNKVVFTWVDGACVTLPADGIDETAADPPRFIGLPRAGGSGGWPVLNGVPELAGTSPEFQPQPLPQADPATLGLIADGAALLTELWPEAQAASRRFLNSLLVQPLAEDHVNSMTADRLQGALICSLRDPVQVADALCHEGSHTRLALVFHVDPLIVDDGAEIHPSPWRSDKRHLKGVLNGIHAFVNVCEFYRRLADGRPDMADGANEIYGIQHARLIEAWDYFSSCAVPTELGGPFLEELGAAVEALSR